MSGEERREGVRFITDLNVVLRAAKGGAPIDDRATAHDVSLKGFKLETQEALAENAVISFVLELPYGGHAAGKGRVVWCTRETFATWAGVEIVSMPWGDRRRLRQLLNPDLVDWARLSNLCFKFVVAVTVVVAAHRLLHSPLARGVLAGLAPKILALIVMGWALLGLMKREKR